jgi:gluconokinase
MIVVLMGVSGVGKTTVGELLAARTGWPFYDADDFHSPASIEKMRNAIPLTDDDRWPWLDRLNALLRAAQDKGEPVILACSALKQRYRDRLGNQVTVRWIHLKGDFELIKSRLESRKGHYMTAKLLESQFDALEEPCKALQIDVTRDPSSLADDLINRLGPETAPSLGGRPGPDTA